MKKKTYLLVEAALFAALCFVATFIIKIPTPGTGGYVHPGDGFVILSGLILGPVWGGAAAAVGSCLADVIGGYFVYVPATFIIKGLTALIVAILFSHLPIKKTTAKLVISGLLGALLVPIGYLCFEVFIYGAAALASVPANALQAGFGVVIATLLYPAIKVIKNKTFN